MPRGISRYDEARLQGRLWTPKELKAKNLAAWYVGGDLSNFVLDGSGNISQWNDSSGKGQHATQSTSANRPAFNPLYSAFMGGSDLALLTPSLSLAQVSVWAACIPIATPGAYAGLIYNRGINVGLTVASTQDAFAATYAGGGYSAILDSLVLGLPYVWILQHDNGVGDYWCWINGTKYYVGNASTSVLGQFYIGYDFISPSGRYWPGVIFEIGLIEQMPTDWEVRKLTGYCAWKYGIPRALRGVNPFANRPPLIGD